AVAGDQLVRRGDDHGAGEGGLCGEMEQVAGVVVEEVQDLHAGGVGEEPVGDVGLPALVGQVGLEADVGALGAFAGLGDDEALAVQDAADGGGGGGVEAFLGQVRGDGGRPGVCALGGEVAA